MKKKKKITIFVLAFAIMLSLGQMIGVQAATRDSMTTVTQESSAIPNPGVPETEPEALSVISQYVTNSANKTNVINITSTIGWKMENGYWYFYKSNNTRATGWINPDNNWYYLNGDGKMATGWLNYNGTWYYLNASGSMVSGWKQLNNIWYYLNDSGAMITGLNKIDNKIYMFYGNGAMAKGWVQLSNHWYYFNSSGNMSSGWISDNGAWYYLYDTGAMAKGWINLDDTWYYLKDSGAMATGWVNVGTDYYYLDTRTGKMLTNTTTSDGFKLGSDGKKIGPGNPGTIPGSKYKGIDISHYNGNIDFAKVKSAGIQFVYIKATEGTTYVDNYLGTYYNGAKSAGLKTGFYHFLVGTSSPETQAQNFYNKIKDKQNDLKPVLDVENTGFDVMDYTIRFINEFKRLSNMDVCIYTYSNFINNLDNRLSKYTLWEANYSKGIFNLPANNIWSTRAGHQYTDQGYIDGINGNVDLDVFTQDILR
ncbi:GH25 family lysozyme [Clostridium saccharoperbutylacetonicum]|uniref:GH25 family lysozyme n=1 Tax=Clostridium saccharoperbutylacetonicum TaxID=36745 RepID=UPI0039ECD347